MSPVVQALAFVPMVLAATLRRLERRTVRRVTDAGATTAERAVLLERAGPVGAFVSRRLERAGVLVAAGRDRYYLNESAYAAFRARRRWRAALVVALLIVGVIVLIARGDIS